LLRGKVCLPDRANCRCFPTILDPPEAAITGACEAETVAIDKM
jgi:hypothetical protein